MGQVQPPGEGGAGRPKSEVFISTAWIIDGTALLVCAGFLALMFILLTPRPHDFVTVPLFLAAFASVPGLAGAIGYALLHIGVRTRQGRTSDIRWQGIGSIVLGLVAPMLVIGRIGWRVGLLPLLFGILLLGAGVLALLARKKYAAWQIAKRTQGGPNERPTEFTEEQGFCSACNKEVLIRRRKPNHALHLFMSLLLGGLWLPIWYARSVYGYPWKCVTCGRTAHSVFSWDAMLGHIMLAVGLVILIAFVAGFWAIVITTPATPFRFSGG